MRTSVRYSKFIMCKYLYFLKLHPFLAIEIFKIDPICYCETNSNRAAIDLNIFANKLHKGIADMV